MVQHTEIVDLLNLGDFIVPQNLKNDQSLKEFCHTCQFVREIESILWKKTIGADSIVTKHNSDAYMYNKKKLCTQCSIVW